MKKIFSPWPLNIFLFFLKKWPYFLQGLDFLSNRKQILVLIDWQESLKMSVEALEVEPILEEVDQFERTLRTCPLHRWQLTEVSLHVFPVQGCLTFGSHLHCHRLRLHLQEELEHKDHSPLVTNFQLNNFLHIDSKFYGGGNGS